MYNRSNSVLKTPCLELARTLCVNRILILSAFSFVCECIWYTPSP
uniref:Uncharacterized protein n=1 Tax=Anguilla anguilla TaxID=7936 RepID=A0A0E9UX60_ANGAN